MNKNIFKCGYCSKEYTQSKRFEKHFTICSFNNNKFKKNSYNKTVTLGTLNSKMDKILLILESQNKRIENLERKITRKKDIKKDILSWLNCNIRINFDLEKWKNNIEITSLDYDYLISDGCISGYSRILFNNISKTDERFIYGFNGGANRFYIYNKKWMKLTETILNKFIFIIQRKLIIMAIDKRDNIKHISEEKENQLLRENSIIYGNLSSNWQNKIYNNLYKKLKIKFDDII